MVSALMESGAVSFIIRNNLVKPFGLAGKVERMSSQIYIIDWA